MKVGINVDPRLGFKAGDIASPGVNWVRSVVRPDHDLGPWLGECHAAGLKVLVVIARESMKRGWTYRAAADYYAKRYGSLADAWQIGNEPDQRSPSSWTLPTIKLGKLIDMFHAAMPAATLIGPGLASGQPSYGDGIPFNLLAACAIHPYGRGPSATEPYAFGAVADLVQLYRRFGKPIWISEFGGPGRDFASEHERAQYHSKMLVALQDCGVETAFQFCWSDAMVPDFGLLDASGKAKESYAAFFDGAQALDGGQIVSAIDVSSHQPRDLSLLLAKYRPEHVVVRLYLPWEAISADYSRAQIASARAHGCTVGGYCWLYRGASTWRTAESALALAEECGVELPVLWFDIEPYTDGGIPTEIEVLATLSACEAQDTRAGIYTGKWVMDQYYPGSTAFSAWPLWDANYNGWIPPDAGYDPGYGGWAVASGRQWTSEGVDRSVFLAGVTR